MVRRYWAWHATATWRLFWKSLSLPLSWVESQQYLLRPAKREENIGRFFLQWRAVGKTVCQEVHQKMVTWNFHRKNKDCIATHSYFKRNSSRVTTEKKTKKGRQVFHDILMNYRGKNSPNFIHKRNLAGTAIFHGWDCDKTKSWKAACHHEERSWSFNRVGYFLGGFPL